MDSGSCVYQMVLVCVSSLGQRSPSTAQSIAALGGLLAGSVTYNQCAACVAGQRRRLTSTQALGRVYRSCRAGGVHRGLVHADYQVQAAFSS